MKLTSITAKALKGRTFTHDLGDLTIIAGPNDSGKTAVANAITLALTGHIPGHPKTNAGLFALASGSKMMVEAKLDGRPAIRREWASRGKTIKYDENGVEDLPETPLVLLDPAEYFGANATRQVEMIFALCPIREDAIDPAAVEAGVNALLKPADFTLPARGSDESVQAWLDRGLDALAEQLTISNANVRRYAGTAQGITALAAAEETLDPAAVEAELAQARGKVEALVKAHAQLEQAAKEVATKQARKRELTSRIATLDGSIAGKPARDVEQIQTELGEAQTRLGILTAEFDAAVKRAQAGARHAERIKTLTDRMPAWEAAAAGLEKWNTEIKRIESELQGMKAPDLRTLHQACQTLRDRLASVKARHDAADATLARERKRVQDLAGARCCPTCGAHGADWVEAIQAMLNRHESEHNTAVAGLAEEHATLSRQLEEAEAAENVAIGAENARQRAERLLGEAKVEHAKAQAADEQRRAALAELEQLGEPVTQAPEPPAELAELRAKVAALTDERTRAAAMAEKRILEAELQAIGTLSDDIETDAYRAECEVETARDVVAGLETKLQQAQAQIADARRRQQAVDERVKAEAAVAAIKAAQDALKENREALVKTALDPILTTANAFVHGIIPTPLEFRDGELGRFDGASWIPVRAFGGTFQAATYAGIQAALGSRAPSRIVIVDELGRFDAANKIKFVANVRHALEAGMLEQFIGIDVAQNPYVNAPADYGLRVIDTSR